MDSPHSAKLQLQLRVDGLHRQPPLDHQRHVLGHDLHQARAGLHHASDRVRGQRHDGAADRGADLAVRQVEFGRRQFLRQLLALHAGFRQIGAHLALKRVATLLAASLIRVAWIKLAGGLYLAYLTWGHFGASGGEDRLDVARLVHVVGVVTREADQAQRQNSQLQQQIDELNAKQTERGLVMTLGDLLFATGRSELRAGTANNLGKLAIFLGQHPERQVLIEGHTDNVGSEEMNLSLSQRRADSVMHYLTNQGVSPSRLGASGKGESMPVAGNESASGRQMNRRVEIIISHDMASQR